VSRLVTVVLLDRSGHWLGALAPFELPFPWWQEVSDIVTAVRRRDALEVVVLRLLAAENPHPPSGAVTYLAELAGLEAGATDALPALRPVAQAVAALALAPHPLRAPWAEPGGPRASLDWVRTQLAALGLGDIRSAEQQRAWNLSTIWRVRGDGEATYWLKQLPRFFAHESAVLRWLDRRLPGLAPGLLATDTSGRQLLADVPGDDYYGTGAPQRAVFAELLHRVQRAALGAVAELEAAGVPDRRGTKLADFIRHWLGVSGVDLAPAAAALASLDDRLSALAACGLPDTLVHGDFHPGNVRGDATRTAILDWGDAFLGQPGFDILRLSGGTSEEETRGLTDAWCERWIALYPRSDPARALTLLAPLAPLLGAAIYARFVAQIEPSEHPFHADDVPAMLALAGAVLEPTATLRQGV
jgi:hypothetical protein